MIKKATPKVKKATPKAKATPIKAAPKAASIKTKSQATAAGVKKTAAPKPAAQPIVHPQPKAAPTVSIPPRYQALADKMDIMDLIHTAARALDRMDETLLRSVFHADATLDFGPGVFQGSAGDYVPWALGVLGQARSTHHFIGQVHVQLQGETGYAETYVQAHFRSDKPTGREDLFMGMRYLDRIEKRPASAAGVYKIIHRKQIIDWVRTESVSDLFYHQNPDALWSYRTKTDPSYQMTQFPAGQSGGKLPAFLGRRYDSKSFRF